MGVLSPAECQALLRRIWQGLVQAAKSQAAHLREQTPEHRAIELLVAALETGRCHLQPHAPHRSPRPRWQDEEWERFGWRRIQKKSGPGWSPRGPQIGWADERYVYLVPSQAYRIVARLAGGDGALGVTESRLGKQLAEAGLLLRGNDGRLTRRGSRKWPDRPRVWVIDRRKIPEWAPRKTRSQEEQAA